MVESTTYQGMPTTLCRLPVFYFASSANPEPFPHNHLQTRSPRGRSRRRRAVGGRIAYVTSLLPCHARRYVPPPPFCPLTVLHAASKP
jgi:hypothetical protein